jgi:LDH2 family malate/lactate/ureidoglycolate dehydrogenase
VRVIDPALFGSREDFKRQTTRLADAWRATQTRPGVDQVRMPGETGLRRRAEQLAHGVELYPGVMATLAPCAQKFGVVAPAG